MRHPFSSCHPGINVQGPMSRLPIFLVHKSVGVFLSGTFLLFLITDVDHEAVVYDTISTNESIVVITFH
jgi:hypothetical protein